MMAYFMKIPPEILKDVKKAKILKKGRDLDSTIDKFTSKEAVVWIQYRTKFNNVLMDFAMLVKAFRYQRQPIRLIDFRGISETVSNDDHVYIIYMSLIDELFDGRFNENKDPIANYIQLKYFLHPSNLPIRSHAHAHAQSRPIYSLPLLFMNTKTTTTTTTKLLNYKIVRCIRHYIRRGGNHKRIKRLFKTVIHIQKKKKKKK